MTIHAAEEMAEDDLTILDIEHAVLSGRVVETQRDDPRGTKHVLQGAARDGSTLVGVVGRFPGDDRYLIITVYKV
jgi:hypothetical protein